ncbi:type VII secretion protein EccCa [Corynebacterium aquatimens]|uniref:S-DNA-T family DNA segregation ATPase FtsK/SpoIIIE n=1 Tax=Corynebacterium aquatimens TaxID=1190508 RepID=A0A931GUR2_9CORY|nr:type VII secretion protein EccCa [Corynebacterium aquatimens]MBG6123045.1 S-DNA-T family DNA segregation ATPase FtsK/SpoIIIE [Corynebacterium aquatimens]WJY66621.1 ESX-1 secretion system protein [Corynebacterium aquatimens]
MLGVDNDPVRPFARGESDPPPLPHGSLDTEPVPQAVRKAPEPLIRLILPVVMVAAIGAMVAAMALSGRGMSPMMMLFPLMMLMGLATALNPQEKAGDIDETRRVYLRHLDALTVRARANADKQRAHSTFIHPHPSWLATAVDAARVWERDAGDEHAMQVRIGLGLESLCTPVEVPDPGSPEDLDPVCAVSLRRTVASVSTVPDMPVVVQLDAFGLVTLAGPNAADVARSIICQLAFFHGPELVGIDDFTPMSTYTKWLPHTRATNEATFRIAVVGADAVAQVPASDYDCIIAVSVDAEALVHDGAFHLVCGGRDSGDGGPGLDVVTATGVEELGKCDLFSDGEAEFVCRSLAYYRRPTSDTKVSGGDLLGLLGIPSISDLTADTMWPGREGTKQRLMVPIGVDPIGAPVYLDLKESAHGGMGPHGLCIGATGSGKSELLRTLVVALAATHSPEELNFVLVDFKGGATFLGAEALPHTSAVITNLENESILVERMHDAISGEMNRRQELLRAAGNFANITDYTAARLASRPDLAPLPALVIVLDEFSELLGQHPDFADLFVAVGRLGRSLGVHLLLASQRLEEGKLRGLDSHLSYRIGLKTFSAAESRQVLGVPDAYELPADPGSGFITSAGTELIRFKASYVSGPIPHAAAADTPEYGAQVSLFIGWDDPIEQLSTAQFNRMESPDVNTGITVMDAIVDAASRAAAQRRLRAHQVWLPPLPVSVEISAVCESVGFMRVAIGLIDEPYHQRQDVLIADLMSSGGHLALAGGPQTGKSMFVRTLITSLAATHSANDVGVYIINAGHGEFAALDSLPHVAAVASVADAERTRRVVDEVLEFIEVHSDADSSNSESGSRHIVLVVDGWHAVMAQDSPLEDLREPLARIASEGPAAGVHLVLTTQRWNAVRPNVRDLIGSRMELSLTEPMDSLVNRKVQEKLPALPGRGLTPQGKYMLVATTADEDIAHVARHAADRGDTPVPRLKEVPAHVDLIDLVPTTDDRPLQLFLGIGGRAIEPVALRGQHLIVTGMQGSGKSTALQVLIHQLREAPRELARMVILDPRRAHLLHADHPMVAAYAGSTDAARAAIADTVATLRSRLPGPEVTAEQLAARSWWEGPELFVLIDDLDLVPAEHLRPLIDLLPHSVDIGLHVVVARKFGGISRAVLSPFLSTLRDQLPDAVVLSGNREEGAVFGIRPTTQPPGRGTYITAGDTGGLIQLADVGRE